MATRGHVYTGAQDFVPDTDDLARTAQAVQQCRGCDLYRDATQGVFGRGSAHARLLLIGEQPGDSEDRQGEPFVGPAGRLLREALGQAGIAEQDVYLTNAVKHFRWRPEPHGGKRRIHQRPDAGQIAACRPWWLAELRIIDPKVIVALGATAGQALFGSSFRVGAARDAVQDWPRPAGWAEPGRETIPVVATIHPSAALRAPDRDAMLAGLVEDLRTAKRLLGPR
jgi:DNA polymerase